jgi:hypothetical protein
MTTLADYLTDTETLLHDFNLQFYGAPLSITRLINKSRVRIAATTQCLRVLVPNASFSTTASQNIYTFSALNSYVTPTTGIKGIMGIYSVAVSQGTIKPILDYLPWQAMQAYMLAYNSGYTGYCEAWSQYGFGDSGSLYVWPIPSGAFATDIDTYCLPLDLVNNTDVCALPYPWTDSVPYYAAYWCLMNAQRHDEAKMMLEIYNQNLVWARGAVQPAVIPSMYPGD